MGYLQLVIRSVNSCVSFDTPSTMYVTTNMFHRFQEVQNLSALETSIRFIPDVVMGILINLGVGFLIHKMSTYWLILISTIITLAAPLCLTTMNKDSSYWVAAFPAMCLIPLSADGKLSSIE